jgi:hypothetical protein
MEDALLLGHLIFSEYIHTILLGELPYEPWVPGITSRHTIVVSTNLYYKEQTHQSSLAIPKSLQQRMSALLLDDSVAVAIPDGSKYSCSPRAMATSLDCIVSDA